jgi:PilZ domain-containing protein
MTLERSRARRYTFITKIELTDVRSEIHVEDRTRDLSLFGCHVDTQKPFPQGTKLKVRIAHRSANFEALARVAYVRPNAGMGIVFTSIDPNDQLILEKWIAELRDQ